MWLTPFWHSWSQFFIFAWDVTAGGILRTGVLICLVFSADDFFEGIFHKNVSISITNSLKIDPAGPYIDKLSLIKVMA